MGYPDSYKFFICFSCICCCCVPLDSFGKILEHIFLDIECIVCTFLFGLLYAGRQFFLVDHDHSDTLEALAPAA